MAIKGFSYNVKNMIDLHFEDSDKFKVYDEIQLYKPSEDPFINAQKKGIIPSIAEVWFDGDYLCDVRSDMFPKDARIKIEQALLDKLSNYKKKHDSGSNTRA